ncbi:MULTISPECIES: type II toxin-antitoxin system RelE/ParE family toxin [unclassified Agrobacterium]|uniref:type II toxin-antitoxin system RelE/ParE family toxin n=1 Tax=unclassified Agrobacterium TaxID=2632611 RepID=UPI00244A06D3|nr:MULTISPECIES: type II toxin-antitoxin system RelE/ParE family toxin [unclassified Agrobacterium]MDH0613865.1 type II toxin-antitoxin system RelE/ParE family toxin [Agrobacterium sp. GD03872]MDH0696754.1 type II toxin-antitoxin system RelE/ParE family toxin [Agrobacterium sp. GD03871]MDH1060082.1 type II toxin-antitoxin system RelE/ParE family toxin [Agrobacterium sp. GD03992]MDH2209995.1 type II toxin-antitoxin system RelE/ParE family toxin [Agrobacterium sp. GD03643]MDH2219494.1 type II to
MKYYAVRLSPEAQTDLVHIHQNIVGKSGSPAVADRYIDRIGIFLSTLNVFPERGTVRNELRVGLRIIGFERSTSVAFVVEQDDVVVLRLLAKGQEFDEEALRLEKAVIERSDGNHRD